MRLLFATPAFPPFPGGGERYAQALAQGLAARGHAITVLTSAATLERHFWQGSGPDTAAEECHGAIAIIRQPLRGLAEGFNGLLLWRKSMALLSALPGDQSRWLMRMATAVPPIQGYGHALARFAGHIDLLHAFNLSWEYPAVEGWRLARRQNQPFVVTPFAHLGVTGRDRVARNSTMDHQLRILADADAVLALTSIERDGLACLGVPAARITVAGSGLDPAPEPIIDETAILRRYRLGLPLTLFVGRVSRDKGALHAAQATLELRRAGVHLHLALVGQAAPEFHRFYSRLSPEDREAIHPLGLLPEAEKHALLETAAMLVLPSRTDSFGIVLLEAWGHGKPVVGARAGGIPGVIRDGEDGLLVEYGDVAGLAAAMRRLLTDPPLRQTMGQRGRARVANEFSWEQVVDRVEAAYEQAIARRADLNRA